MAGEKTNKSLERISAVKTTLGEWKKLHPKTSVLSEETGYSRDYFGYPYGSYYTDETLIFDVRNQDQLEIHPKEIISYIWEADDKTPQNKFSGKIEMVAHEQLKEQGERMIDFGGQEIKAVWDEELKTVRFFSEEEIPSSTAFAFVYPAYFGE